MLTEEESKAGRGKYPERRSKVVSLAEAGKMIAECKVISVGGVHSTNAPMALIREGIRAGAKGLTIMPTASIGIAGDLLVAAGCVDTFYVSYVGLEFLGFAPAFRRAAEAKAINVSEIDEASVIWGFKAAAGGVPFIPFARVFESTDLPRANPSHFRTTKDPYSGEEVVTIPPLKSDIFICHVQQADEFGNSQLWGKVLEEDVMAKAADRVIISTDEIVPVEKTRQDPLKTTIAGYMVEAVVHLPFGAHPTSSSGRYEYDEDHIRLYRDLVRDKNEKEYISRFVLEPKSHYEYLELIGLERLFELSRIK